MMTAAHLINNTIPQLQVNDTVAKALQLMNDFKSTHLPVVEQEKYLGLISEEDLLDKDNTEATLEYFKNDCAPAFINENQHFIRAVAVGQLYHTNIIPVVSDAGELMGAIRQFDLVNALGNLCGAGEFGALLVLEIDSVRLSVSEINSIVESDGASILHLNISMLPPSPLLQVTLQVNKKEVSTIIASFERYDYSVSFYSGEELFENQLSTNYQNLMNYLHI